MNSKNDGKTYKELGDKLRKARQKAKLTQAQLAEKAGVGTNYYATIERGESNPSYEILQSIKKALNLKTLDI